MALDEVMTAAARCWRQLDTETADVLDELYDVRPQLGTLLPWPMSVATSPPPEQA